MASHSWPVEQLEARRMLSLAAGGVVGAPVAVVDSPHILDLYGSDEVATHWVIDWGDGFDCQELPATQAQVVHFYEDEMEQATIRAYLLEPGEEPSDVTPDEKLISVQRAQFQVFSDDSTFPQIEGQPVGLFLSDEEALIEFQCEQAQPGDTYRILWGDGAQSIDYVLVDADNNGVADPVQWLAGNLLELHQYYSLEKVTAVLRLTTQTNVY